jgi:hypothetical protein
VNNVFDSSSWALPSFEIPPFNDVDCSTWNAPWLSTPPLQVTLRNDIVPPLTT